MLLRDKVITEEMERKVLFQDANVGYNWQILGLIGKWG